MIAFEDVILAFPENLFAKIIEHAIDAVEDTLQKHLDKVNETIYRPFQYENDELIIGVSS